MTRPRMALTTDKVIARTLDLSGIAEAISPLLDD